MTDTSRPSRAAVVEDDEGLQRQLKWAYDGYRVVVAGDRAQAIEALRAARAGGRHARPRPAARSRRHRAKASRRSSEILRLKPDTKVIVATGHGARESALKAIALGAYDFYQKPVDIDELGLIVARAFHLHEIEDENRRLESDGGGDGARLDHHRARPRCSRSARRSSGSPAPTSR